MFYLAMGPYCWGKGQTREEAVQNAKQNFPRSYFPKVKRVMDKHFSIYTCDSQMVVTDMGYIHTENADNKITKIQTSILADKD